MVLTLDIPIYCKSILKLFLLIKLVFFTLDILFIVDASITQFSISLSLRKS